MTYKRLSLEILLFGVISAQVSEGYDLPPMYQDATRRTTPTFATSIDKLSQLLFSKIKTKKKSIQPTDESIYTQRDASTNNNVEAVLRSRERHAARETDIQRWLDREKARCMARTTRVSSHRYKLAIVAAASTCCGYMTFSLSLLPNQRLEIVVEFRRGPINHRSESSNGYAQ